MNLEGKAGLRLVDANLNRLAEGLRSIEDIARLVYEDRAVAQWMKSLRHEAREQFKTIERAGRLAARSTATDPGTTLATEQERRRADWMSVVSAAPERVGQSLRVLEEAAKVVIPTQADAVKQLRYQAYDLLARTELRLGSVQSMKGAQLYLLVDCTVSLNIFCKQLKELANAGVDLFQLRDKQADGGKLIEYCRAAIESLADTSAGVIVNDRVDVAVAGGADGVHVGQDDLPINDVRQITPASMWVGVSTHSIQQAVDAQRAGADYIGCGPTFRSSTKQFEEFAGTSFLREVAEGIEIPFFAIGGITRENITEVLDAGCDRVAISAAICSAESPVEAASRISIQLRDRRLGQGVGTAPG